VLYPTELRARSGKCQSNIALEQVMRALSFSLHHDCTTLRRLLLGLSQRDRPEHFIRLQDFDVLAVA